VQTRQLDAEAAHTLMAILDTEISPELVPADAAGDLQSTQQKVGPYELQEVAFLAWHAWRDVARGAWPPNFPHDAKHAYTLHDIKHWLRVFLYRFFEISQYKRSALPNGPKVLTGGSLSPRGDWRAPSDGNAKVWLDELERNVP
jgi:NAD+ synthase (glutamine-hydrolysing)